MTENNKPSSVSAIILTYNEELHVERCINSLVDSVDKIYILDSFSTDRTIEVASKFDNVEIKQNKFINHAVQFNFALEVFDIDTDWVMRIDADEYIDRNLSRFLNNSLDDLPSDVNGVVVNRFITFMGRLLKHGGMSDYWTLRIWRNGKGYCEQRWMDEHIVLTSGSTTRAPGRLVDDNLNTLSWWAHKHVDYSTREAIDVLISESSNSSNQVKSRLFGTSAERNRFFKHIYNQVPKFTRPFIYFIYRYVIRMGFLDGKQGFLWHILQGFWYRMMVDAKVFEIKSAVNVNSDLKQVVKNKYDYEI
ncbi:SPBc2 prophage-derived glycosyltransferase SunS [Vibrio mediterranei]|uniref:glycosyltransferase family 2 protein n=1 Tax=Vibrio mediterranei TaxID=689 RepID=UPI0007823D21|nr:glycosyltransferase family 2 protein [Vibrio mediterranei]SBO12204.1 SPBc2 prophage-derived glycosyltransferase SunS [Vibrio mediterranei]